MSDQSTLPIPLRVAIIGNDQESSSILRTVIMSVPNVEEAYIYTSLEAAHHGLRIVNTNSIIIDIYSFNLEAATGFIGSIRKAYPLIAFCLYGYAEQLRSLAGVPDQWNERLAHYFKLAKDQGIQEFHRSVEDVAYALSREILRETARRRLSEVSQTLQKSQQGLSEQVRGQIQEATSLATSVIESRPAPTVLQVAGIPANEELQKLVLETIERANASVGRATQVNIAVLIGGGLILVVALIAALWKPDWITVAFGGFGLAGIVAALVTNPLKTIGMNARRVVQVQVAYLSFITQLSMLGKGQDEQTLLERSRLLGEEVRAIQQTLHQFFGD